MSGVFHPLPDELLQTTTRLSCKKTPFLLNWVSFSTINFHQQENSVPALLPNRMVPRDRYCANYQSAHCLSQPEGERARHLQKQSKNLPLIIIFLQRTGVFSIVTKPSILSLQGPVNLCSPLATTSPYLWNRGGLVNDVACLGGS